MALKCILTNLSIEPCFADVQAQGEAAEHPVGKSSAIHLPRATDAFYAKLLPALEVCQAPYLLGAQ